MAGAVAIVAALVLVTGVILWTAPPWLVDWVARRRPGCLYRMHTTRQIVALTIDDGPDSVSTPSILEQLRRHRSSATFFLISGRVRGQEDLVKRILRDGHELGNHFTQDKPSIRLSPEEFEADLLEAHRVLAGWGRPGWARPGSGWYTREMVEVMERHGYRCALGSVYPFDVAIPSVGWATRYILRNARPGAIVVLHDGGSRGLRTARILSVVLPELRKRGYEVLSLERAIGHQP